MERDETPGKWQRADYVLCVALLSLGMVARLWNLSLQSVWYDEYITLTALDAGSLWAALKQELTMDWSMVPAYHVLQYGWAHFIARSDYGIRWLSILLSVPAFPLLYAIARRLAGRWAAAVALLFLALAPYHIFHAQGIRNYSLALTAALACVYFFLCLLEAPARKRWWVSFGLSSALLMLTHVFGLFLFVAQGLYLLLFHRRPLRLLVVWSLVMATVMLPVAAWILLMQNNGGYPDAERPAPARLYEVVFGHYTHPFNWVEYNVPPANEHGALGPLGAMLMARNQENGYTSLRLRDDLWLRRAGVVLSSLGIAIVLRAALLGGINRKTRSPDFADRLRQLGVDETKMKGVSLAAVAKSAMSPGGDPDCQSGLTDTSATPYPEVTTGRSCRQVQWHLLLLLWLFIPTLVLFAMAWLLQRSVFQERYLVYAYPALYILIGLGVQALRWRTLKATAFALLAGLLSVQAVAYQVVPVRHDFLGAVRLFKEQVQPGDKLILHRMLTAWQFFYNLHEPERPYVQTGRFEELVEQVEVGLREAPHVWVVTPSIPAYVGGDPDEVELAERLMATCQDRGWACSSSLYLGMQNTWLFRVGRGG